MNTLNFDIAMLRYLMLLTSLGAQLGVQSDDFFKNPVIL